MEITFGILFDRYKHTNLIDGVFYSQALHIETGSEGDKVSDFKNHGVLIEVPNTNFDKIWSSYIVSVTKEKYKNKGVPRNQIDRLVKEHISSAREFWNLRRE